jgi:fucose 4-O-acetylase-like acetyltransferase
MPETQCNRDDLLDITKGIGIMLVILGHIIQGNYINFDQNIFFRIIYSFHMPLFFFISGAVLNAKYVASTPNRSKAFIGISTKVLLKNCKKSFFRLMIPFFTWSVILFFTGKRYLQMNVMEWGIMIVNSIGYSLWFLPAIFYCLVFFYISQYFATYSLLKCSYFNKLDFNYKQIIFLISSLAFSALASKIIPNWFGIAYFKQYYQYFIIGIVWYAYFRNISTLWTKLTSALVFFALVPFWYRVESSTISEFFPEIIKQNHADSAYKVIVALAGISVVLGISEIIKRTATHRIKTFFVYCGTMSLGIYAFQFHFLGVKPYFIAPLLISLICCLIINRVPVARVALLGADK